MEIGREEMYIARGHPRMGACTLSRSLSLSKGRRRVAETRTLRQACFDGLSTGNDHVSVGAFRLRSE